MDGFLLSLSLFCWLFLFLHRQETPNTPDKTLTAFIVRGNYYVSKKHDKIYRSQTHNPYKWHSPEDHFKNKELCRYKKAGCDILNQSRKHRPLRKDFLNGFLDAILPLSSLYLFRTEEICNTKAMAQRLNAAKTMKKRMSSMASLSKNIAATYLPHQTHP